MSTANRNINGAKPEVEDTAYIHPTAVIIGRVKIGGNVFVGPGAVVRADEQSSSITIESNCNIQDRVLIHALEGSSVLVGKNTSLAHGCIVHGPSKISENCFIGFGSVIFSADINNGVCIKHLVVVEGVTVLPERIIESHSLINCETDVVSLGHVDKKNKEFMERVVEVNLNLVEEYKNRELGPGLNF